MSYNWAPYQGATYCIGSPQPGAVAMAAFLKEKFPTSYLGNIYSCRDIVGGSGRSHHAEGRAIDQMHPATSPSISYEMVKMLGPHGRRLGIDHIIANKKPWASGRGEPVTFSASTPNGRVYTGSHPHKDHAHVGLTRTASKSLTLATIRWVVDGTVDGPIEGIDMSDYKTIAGLRYYDYKKWPSFAVPSITKAIETGIIIGKTFTSNERDRIWDAHGDTTRAELAVVMSRAGVLK